MNSIECICWFVDGKLIHVGEWDFCEDGGVVYSPLPDGAKSKMMKVTRGDDGFISSIEDIK